MKSRVIIIAALLLPSVAYAQNVVNADSLRFSTDSLLVEETQSRPDIFETVQVEQSSVLETAFRNYVEGNSSRRLTGYRVRIYFDSSREARAVSEQVMRRFEDLYPDIPVYRSYSSPFFKVAAGDFRTRDDAHRFATMIAPHFPSAFLVRETINFPILWSSRD